MVLPLLLLLLLQCLSLGAAVSQQPVLQGEGVSLAVLVKMCASHLCQPQPQLISALLSRVSPLQQQQQQLLQLQVQQAALCHTPMQQQ